MEGGPSVDFGAKNLAPKFSTIRKTFLFFEFFQKFKLSQNFKAPNLKKIEFGVKIDPI